MEKFYGEEIQECIDNPFSTNEQKNNNNKKVDEVIRSYFPDYSYKGVMIEIGAFDPVVISNSYHFELNGWDTHCIDANKLNFGKFGAIRKNLLHVVGISDYNQNDVPFYVNCEFMESYSALDINTELHANRRIIDKDGNKVLQPFEYIQLPVNVRTLDFMLENQIKVDKIDVISIDIEGGEFGALKGFTIQKYKPKLMVVEDHFIKTKKLEDNEIYQYFIKNGYKLDKICKYNSFYIPVV